jgi:excisionase family DNA binding protein
MEHLSLRDRLRRIVEALPPGAAATLPRDTLAEWIGETEPRPLADLTVPEVAAIVGRAPSTVRGWCQDGELRAYRLQGREWRITREALREFQDRQADAEALTGDDDLSSWRTLAPERP